MTTENKMYKSSVFSDLFYTDETTKENELSLFNALHGTNYKIEDVTIEKIRVENTIYMSMANDASFCLSNKVLVLTEHQSTINMKMPLRDLLYVARVYEILVPREARYKKKAAKIPYPEFYVLYNGKEEMDSVVKLKLSDVFNISENDRKLLDSINDDRVSLELITTVININVDAKSEVLEKCPVLKEYSQFVECVESGILADYLRRKDSEVVNMLCAEYDYEMDIRVQRQEAAEKAAKIATEETKIKSIKTSCETIIELGHSKEEAIHVIAPKYNMSEEEIRNICNQ